MKFSQVLSLARDMEAHGMKVYIVKNTVYDLLQHKEAGSVQLVVSVGLNQVEAYCKEHGHAVGAKKDDVLTCTVNGTAVQIMTLKYMTCDDFLKKVLPTDFTANTLVMNTDEKIMDLYDAVSAIRKRNLVPVQGFKIKDAQFMPGLYLDIITKVYADGFSGDAKLMPDLFSYIRTNAGALSDEQKNIATDVFFAYCCGGGTAELQKNFLKIPAFYRVGQLNGCSEIAENGVKTLTEMNRDLFLSAIAYLYQVSKNTVSNNSDLLDSHGYAAIMEYAGKDLKNESLYDKATEAYGFSVVDQVVSVQKTIAAMKGEAYRVPRFHHKSVFAEMDERFSWTTFDIKTELPKEETFGTDFDDVASLLHTAEMTSSRQRTPMEQVSADTLFSQYVPPAPHQQNGPVKAEADNVAPTAAETPKPVEKPIDEPAAPTSQKTEAPRAAQPEGVDDNPFQRVLNMMETPEPVLYPQKSVPTPEPAKKEPVKKQDSETDAQGYKSIARVFEEVAASKPNFEEKISEEKPVAKAPAATVPPEKMEDVSSVSTHANAAQNVTQKFRRIVLGQ